MKSKLLCVFGTRPETIKMAPLVRALKIQSEQCITKVCVTGQHRQMLDQMLNLFEITPDYDLNLMQSGQTLTDLTVKPLAGLQPILNEFKPDWLIVQGDTTTAFSSALAAFYQQVKVAHVEAGLRTYNAYSPWPEEMNRRLLGSIASVHYAPTQTAVANLLAERIPEDTIVRTGNTAIDALLWVSERLQTDDFYRQQFRKQFDFLDQNKSLILVTGHRRENWDGGLARVFKALKEISKRKDVQILYPVHLNPKVQKIANEILEKQENIILIKPLDYLAFVYVMQRSHIIVTDSGGVQEEAPTLGKPVVVIRDTTERMEGVEAGTSILAGTQEQDIVKYINQLLDDVDLYKKMSLAHNPYGDGTASQYIVNDILTRSTLN